MNYPIKGIVVLLLEQNEKEKELFLQVLKNAETNIASALTATSFQEAQQLLEHNRPDIIFSSVFPEDDNNEAFINTLKELSIIIPLVMISDDDHNNVSLKSLALGADDQIFRKELSGPLLRKTIQYSIERKKNNEQLREAIERHQLIAKATNDIAWDWEITKKNTYWIGNGIKHILKFPKNEMNIASGFWENHLHPDDKERVINKLKQVFEKDHSNNWEDEYRFKNQEGEYKFIYDRGFIIYRNNVPVRMLGIMEDITAKVLLEKKLETEKLLKQKQISEAVITAQEKERTEIGKELHDNVNQLLSASRLYIDAAITDKKNETFLLNQASSFIKNAIEEIRILSKALHTPLINELGLKESINNLAEEIMAVSELKIKVNCDDFEEGMLNENFKLTIYRIIQEQLTNILKHAKAANADIMLSNNDQFVLIEIKDNGIGFDINQKRQGIGIANIHSRAGMYNGTIRLDSKPLKGCTLYVRFPASEVLGNIVFNSSSYQ